MSQYPLIGKTLRNRYKVVTLLGSGGFGNTYKAVDLDLPGQPLCVVKHLKPKGSSPTVMPIAKRLFEKEAQTLYRLGNENNQIPQLFAHFEEKEEFYLVQEFIDGHDLTTEITSGEPLSEKVVFSILKDILEVLAFVHQNNVIHRDIKPQNLRRRRKDEKIVLIDFGAVKEIGALSVNTQGQTTQTVAIGTPGYMPSEQQAFHAHFSSDIYAVGMIGIQALTGLDPHKLTRDFRTGEFNCSNLSECANVNPGLVEILDTMVRYDYRQRYKDATVALEALQQLQPFVSFTEKKEIFHTELVKHGVGYQKADQAAWILASGKPDELLTDEEIQLVTEVCQEWSRQHKRLTSILKDYRRFE
ncbi:serine/threonine-protein kinase [Iningainema tapete]|uniref:non-specific serine/threonine protein kinase n=1 Tax=Iningainema tapete BLCC-T55 TaxID=2748662 RepID=A0A8J7C0I2_9CYAN|nr:serine/threonine-protein kinase [Iningainema tapete]MBD2778068.1 serine/threonine protein kinase [Iningainema tapete BLCC-T55]